jgi:hypothetical protein
MLGAKFRLLQTNGHNMKTRAAEIRFHLKSSQKSILPFSATRMELHMWLGCRESAAASEEDIFHHGREHGKMKHFSSFFSRPADA